MLRDVQTYIADHNIVSVTDLTLHFHTNINALQPMLNKLSRKGRIRKLPAPEKCADCTCCDHSDLVCYQWVGTESHLRALY
ncbi:MAG: FeoC-like transcriptional regulator [Leptolyngbyaceae cyanobacterium]